MRDGIAERFLRFANGDGNGNGKAALAGAAKRAVADDLRCKLHVCIGQDDHMILCAALALHAFATGGRARINMPGDGSRADKTNRANLRMVAERIDHVAAAVDEVYDSFWQAGLVEEFKEAAHR